MSASDILRTIKDNDVKFVDFRFTDPRGKEMHFSIPAGQVDEETFESGNLFDGSSIDTTATREPSPNAPKRICNKPESLTKLFSALSRSFLFSTMFAGIPI